MNVHPVIMFNPDMTITGRARRSTHFHNGSTADAMTALLRCRGGIQIVFPQYGRPEGIAAVTGASWPSLPSNGFLNHLHWSICSSSAQPGTDPQPSISLKVESDDSTLELWPHHFSAVYTVGPPAPNSTSPLLLSTCGKSQAATLLSTCQGPVK